MNQKLSNCQGCPLENIGTGFVPGDGWTGRKIWLLGEFSNETEILQGKPFLGGHGRVLNALLAEAGIWREECYATNVIKCKPPYGKPLTKETISFCTNAYLKDELLYANEGTTIIMFGAIPLLALTGYDKVIKRRGSWYKSFYTKGNLLSTIHPATVIKEQKWWPIVIGDLKNKAKVGFQPPKVTTYELKPSFGAVQYAVERIISQKLNYSLDIETSFESVYQSNLLCIGLGFEDETLCIPWSGNYWKENEKRILNIFFDLFENGPGPIVQNGLFDMLFFYQIGFPLVQPSFDTMLAHHLLFAELPHDLGFLTSIYTNMPYYKDEGKGDPKLGSVPKEQLWLYNSKDVDSTLQCAIELKKELEEFGLTKFFYEKVMPIVPVLIKMMSRGLIIDDNKVLELKIPLQKSMEVLLTGLKLFAGEADFNPLSPKQLSKVLYEKFKMPVLKRTATKAPSTDEDTLTKLLVNYPNPLLEGIMEYRKMNIQVSTFLSPKKERDEKVHSSFLLHGTVTGRLSSRNPNLQNVPEKLRAIYIPTEGKLMYQFDYSQIELRIMSYLSGEEEWINAIENPERDIHSENAQILFQVPIEQCLKGVKIQWRGKERELRKFTKSYIYCIAEGETVGTLNGDIPIQEIKKGMWTYSWDGIAYAPTEVLQLHSNGLKECIKIDFVYLSGQKSSLTCTPDHKILMKDGTYKEAGNLLVGDRVMPFKRAKLCGGKYREIDPFNNSNRVYEHRWVYGFFNDIDDTLDIHHIDGNSLNNNPLNLQMVNETDHLFNIHNHNFGGKRGTNNQYKNITHCKRGHEFTKNNTYITKQGSRQCIECLRVRKGYTIKSNDFDNIINHRVSNITKVGLKNVYCITVKNESHNFPISSAGVWVANCLLYGGGVEAVLSTDPGILTVVEAKAAEFRLMSTRSKVKAFREKIKYQVEQTKTLTNAFGRPRIFFGSKSDILSQAYDFPMQSTAAEIINDAMKRIDSLGIPGLLCQVHDSLLFEWSPEEEHYVNIVREEMEKPISLEGRIVSIPVDITKGFNWYEQTKI